MSVTADDVRRIARLARLAEPEGRVEALVGELNGILNWIEQLNEVDVEGVQAMTTPVAFPLPMRADDVTDGGIRDKVLANAPKSDEGFFVVPKSVE
jgi:aspartyl-tRNA(Asn)/glutamyl-tRNA(Gln) amidotransferase subunit C